MIGELLVENGYITSEQLDVAREIQREKHRRLYSILMDMGLLSERDFVEFLHAQSHLASIDLVSCEIDQEILDLIPAELAHRLEIVPIGKMGNLLTVAMVCPIDEVAKIELEKVTGLKIRAVLCSRSDILRAIKRYYETTEQIDTEYLLVQGLINSEDPLTVQEISTEDGLWTLEGPIKLQRITELIEEIEDLPTLPDIVNLVFAIANDPNSSAEDLAKVIKSDPALTAKILRHANSPYYGFPKRISSIKHAIALLGFKGTRALALSASIFDQLDGKAAIDFKEYWNHSFKCATLAKLISLGCARGSPEKTFIAGLLHDVGKVMLATSMPGKYGKLRSMQTDEMTPLETEEELLGLTHAEVGFLLGEHWDLPSELTNAIRYHHRPTTENAPTSQAEIVFLADRFSDEEILKLELKIGFDESVAEVLDILKISEGALRNVLETYAELASEINLF